MTDSSDAIYGQDLTSAQTADLTQADSSELARGSAQHPLALTGSARVQLDVSGWFADPHPRRRATRLALALAIGTDEGLLQANWRRSPQE